MGIITKEAEVKVNSNTVEYYKSLGYEIPMKKASKSYRNRTKKEFVYDFSKTIIVDVKDLHKSSNVYIDILCDMCKENMMNVRYADYNRTVEATGSYVCKDCSCIKGRQTTITHYGELYLKTEEFKERRKKTCLDKFGVESPLQNKEIMEKTRLTNIQRYGCPSPSQVPEFKEKAKLTTLEHFGVDNASKSEEIKEKTRLTNIKKYGVPYTQQSPEVRAKANETLCKNGNQKTSKQQLYLHNLYGGELNFFIKYYATDICFPEEKLVVEYDGGGHALRVTLGRLTQEEFDKKEVIRNNILKREGYKQMRIISSKDLLPSDSILLQMLQDARNYFSEYPNHSWIEFNLDAHFVRNAENPKGSPYSYGQLRTIKESDLQTNNNINNTVKEDDTHENVLR